MPSSEALQLNEEFSLEAWVEPVGPLSGDPVIFKESEGFLGYGLGIGSIHEGRPEGLLNAGGEDSNVFGPSRVEENVWTHLAVTYDGRDLRLYVNGELVATRSVTGKVTIGSGPLYIGCAPAYEESFEGRIDEPRIYERALTGGEVQQTMNSTFPTVDAEATSEVESEDAMMFGTVQVDGPGTEYYFQYGPTTSYGEIANRDELLGNGETVEVDQTAIELAPETTYHYRLVVEGPFGTSYGKDETFTTGPAEEEGLAPLAESSAAHEAGEFFGINWDGSHKNMASPPTGRNDFKRIEESGSKYVRFRVYPEPGLKESFEQAEKHNLNVIPYIGEGNVPSGGERTQIIKVAKEMVAEFGPGTSSNTRVWEIGNEPNIPVVGATPEQELDKIKRFAEYYYDVVTEVREVKHATHFLLPGLFGFKQGETHLSARQYLKILMADIEGIKPPLPEPYVGVSIHPYVFRVRDHNHPKLGSHRPSSSTPEDAVELTKEVQRTVSGIHSLVKGKGLPIWVTELGFPLGSNNSKFPPVSGPEEQAHLVRQTFSKLLEKRHKLNIEHALVYNIQTLGSEGVWYQRCGLFDAARHPYEAWSKFIEVVEEE